MLSAQLLDTLEEIGRIMRGNSAWFGRICLILVGDFWQLPPIGSYIRVSESTDCSAALYTVLKRQGSASRAGHGPRAICSCIY